MCLTFERGTLLGCGDNFVDGFIVGRSRDLGRTFERVADFGCLAGPVACGASSGAGMLCPAVWPAISQQIGGGVCDPREVTPDRSCLPDAGAGGEAGAGAEAGGGGGSGLAGMGGGRAGMAGREGRGGASAGTGSQPPAENGSCGCRLATGGRGGAALVTLALLLVSFCTRRATQLRRRPNRRA
jgi:hypothetical protein